MWIHARKAWREMRKYSKMAINAASDLAQKVLGGEETTTTNLHTDLSRQQALQDGDTMLALNVAGQVQRQSKGGGKAHDHGTQRAQSAIVTSTSITVTSFN